MRARIERDGPISVADYMAACNAHYYATRDPLGAAGDFITAPEISQMFGELVGAWLADLWDRAGRPEAAYVELGPGRGTLAADALRVMVKAGLKPPVHFIETSPALREAQAARVPAAAWHDGIESLPRNLPLLVVANEFFDALPIEQYDDAARPLSVAVDGQRFVRTGRPSSEASPASTAFSAALASRIAAQGGAALIVDYGYAGPSRGDTLQAVERHAFADPWQAPGERDLTAHVSFSDLAEAAAREGVSVAGPIGQGEWLRALGIDARSAALASRAPDRIAEIEAARRRLTAEDQMGVLFKVMAMVAPGWPAPAGLAR